MKQLTDLERLGIAMSLLGNGVKRDTYFKLCSKLEQDCERNGFYNVPEECEGFECSNCTMVNHSRHEIDCPYVEND